MKNSRDPRDWSYFERTVFEQLLKIERRISKLEARVLIFGAAAGLIMSVLGSSVIGPLLLKHLSPPPVIERKSP